MKGMLSTWTAAALVVATQSAFAQDKSQHSLFNPTPNHQLRDMTTDRPDITESPFTVDAGRVQVETTAFGYSRSPPDIDGVVTDAYEIATTNIRVGLTKDTEINFVWQPYATARSRQPGVGTVRDSGIGGFDIRGKINLWGNDTFDRTGSAMTLLPFITLPTDEDNGISAEFVEGGLIVPLAVALPNNFGLGLNGGAVWVKDDEASGYHTEFIATASLAYEWSDNLGTYWEIAATFSPDGPRGDEVILATGVTYAVTNNLQLDAGINFGITEASDRFNPFVGVSQRF